MIKAAAAERAARGPLPDLSYQQILHWADLFNETTGGWPHHDSGVISGTGVESWLGIEAALMLGLRGFPGGETLPQLLNRERRVRNKKQLPTLSNSLILGWVDCYRRQTGGWPHADAGTIEGTQHETWLTVDHALRDGTRGLAGGSSLAQLLDAERDVPNRLARPRLTVKKILRWADAHHRRTGRWPTPHSGEIRNVRHETWSTVAAALASAGRGLPAGLTLPRLLHEQRGVRYQPTLQPISPADMLRWADTHRKRTGGWPHLNSGDIPGTLGETWHTIHSALSKGLRGLPGASSLARFLLEHRGVRYHLVLPPLRIETILSWADAHHQRTGTWPKASSGPVEDAEGEEWSAVANALRAGQRGLKGSLSLARLLLRKRGVRHHLAASRLSVSRILRWADDHHARTGFWPSKESGPIHSAPGEVWSAVGTALDRGLRGLPGRSTLAQLLAEHRNVRNPRGLAPLTVGQILRWADAHYQRTGSWPKKESGPVVDAPGETWKAIAMALIQRGRGLKRGGTLARLLARERGLRNHMALPPLSEAQVLAWADAHHQRAGSWPQANAGAIPVAPGEFWQAVDAALRQGHRGLPGGSSLRKLLAKHRGVRNPAALAPLTLDQILAWAEAHHEKTGRWPKRTSGIVEHVPGETWRLVNVALAQGLRGLPRGLSLARLLTQYRGVPSLRSSPSRQNPERGASG